MTRYARGNKGNRKRPHDATSWTDLQSQGSEQSHQRRAKADEDDTSKRKQKTSDKSTKKRRKQQEKPKLKNESAQSGDKSVSKTPESLHDALKQESCGSLQSSLNERLAPWSDGFKGENRRMFEADGKKDRRREERRLKRIKNKANSMVCYHCREAGHGVADCPKMLRDEEQGTGICFRCGSTEHEAIKCTARVDHTKGDFPFAKCFICQEIGHLSRSCPDNPRGLYPLGGGCKHCGSVEHKNQHCPHSIDEQKGSEDHTLPTLDSTLSWSADAEIDEIKPRPVAVRQATKKIPKVVKF